MTSGTSSQQNNQDSAPDYDPDNADGGLIALLTLENRPWLRTLALIATIGATIFLLWRSDEPTMSSDDRADLRGTREPDGFVVNGSYTSYNESGELEIQFTSPRIEQFEEGNLATVEAPKANIFGEQGDTSPWQIEAENGSLLQNEGILYLTGNVRVFQQLGERDITLTTESLTLDNDLGIVYTDAPVTIADKTGVTRANGMQAWIDKRIVELKSQVEGRYETGK
ncbi:LPS export ABC transporter periplasmic protein LptC [Marinobacter sp. F4216]|uniref:LPS export ABC transporter periplasmic protein LptC n=1 Tax=Marinobacter sp. F4216 TaxID=2874281 RepID=UPI0029584521|nr:LPS export ABC transporter periplasmic protein LptC [Marinobacter sp. F4216]